MKPTRLTPSDKQLLLRAVMVCQRLETIANGRKAPYPKYVLPVGMACDVMANKDRLRTLLCS